jgi:site-specific recombinase XerD
LPKQHKQKTGRPPTQQTLGDWNGQTVLSFLDHLEKVRGCHARTRNTRLAALQAFMRYVSGQVPQALALTSQVLAIPLKRFDRQLVQSLSVPEAQAILAATDLTIQSGRRDHLLFNFLYHTGARVSEALRLQQQDIHWGPSSTACLHGKGRKERVIPLLKPIAQELKFTLSQNSPEPLAFIFQNRFGQPLTLWGVEKRLRRIVQQAIQHCPSLQGRTVSPHTFRHYADPRTMPIAKWLGHRVSRQHGPTDISRRHSFGIVLAGSEALEESQQGIVGFEELTASTSLVSLSESLLLERQIRIKINLGGLDGLMP